MGKEHHTPCSGEVTHLLLDVSDQINVIIFYTVTVQRNSGFLLERRM